jgi:hypothetical protein
VGKSKEKEDGRREGEARGGKGPEGEREGGEDLFHSRILTSSFLVTARSSRYVQRAPKSSAALFSYLGWTSFRPPSSVSQTDSFVATYEGRMDQ